MALLLLTVSGSVVAQESRTTLTGDRPSPPFDFEFSGVYSWGEVISALCDNGWCRTQLPREFHDLQVPLNVYEKTFDDAFKALSMQARADGYILKKTGRKPPYTVVATLDEDSKASYISCADTSVKEVSAKDLQKHIRADSLKCKARMAKVFRDSVKAYNDSLVLPTTRYRVSFYVVSSNYVRSLGIDWTAIWAKGDLVSMPDFITDWTLRAVADNDTSAEFRSVELDVDTSASLHWGSQRKEEKSIVTYSNGVSQQDYEWKNYGLTLELTRSFSHGIRGDYTLAQRDENNSILSGNFGGGDFDQDSIVAYGVYDSYQSSFVGIPWLSSLPLVGYLFGHEVKDKVKSFFVIQIYRVQRDTVFHDFVYNDSLRVEDINKYERIEQDSTDSELDSLDTSED